MPVPRTPCDMSGQHELDVPADPTAVQVVNVAIDALVGPEVHPFWRARLGYWGGEGAGGPGPPVRSRAVVLVPADGSGDARGRGEGCQPAATPR